MNFLHCRKIYDKMIVSLLIVILTVFSGFSSKLIVDPDSDPAVGTRYKTINDCIGYITSHPIDTILFTKAVSDTYDMTSYLGNSNGPKYITSIQNNPDSFPVIHIGNDYYNYFAYNNVTFEKVIFEGQSTSTTLKNGQTHNTINFKQCIVRNYSKIFFFFEPPSGGTGNPHINFENCLFTQNTDTIFHFSAYNAFKYVLSFKNCTFDNCKSIFNFTGANSGLASTYDSITLSNSIITNYTVITPDLIKPKIMNTFINGSINLGEYGTGCINSTEGIYVKYPGRTIPSDWKIKFNSLVYNTVDTALTPRTDIGSQTRRTGSMSDMGCWEFQNTPPTNITLSASSFPENGLGNTFIGKISTTDTDSGDIFTYALAVSGDDTLFSISNDTLKFTGVADYETKSTYSISIRSTDAGLNTISKPFTISVTNVNDAPTNISLSSTILPETSPVGTTVGVLTASDPDAGETFTFTLMADGTSNNNYFEITGSTLKTKTLVNTAPDTLSVHVLVTDHGSLTFDKIFKISILRLPVITNQPVNVTVLNGKPASFAVTATGNSMSYQWKRNGLNLSGAITSTLLIPATSMLDSNSKYTCIVTNAAGSVTSDTAILYVNNPATFSVEATSSTIVEGDSTIFKVAAVGSGTLVYQWYRNDTSLVSATLDSIKVSAVTIANDSGDVYKCIVSNLYGADTCSAILHVVKATPRFTISPKPDTVPDFSSAVFTCKAAGSMPIKYAWFSSKSATDTLSKKDTLIVNNVLKARDSGTGYYCIASNNAGSCTSTVAILHVTDVGPTITVQPDTLNIYQNANALFTIQAGGTPPLQYKWYKVRTNDISDSLTENDTLLLVNVPLSDSGTVYFCVVINPVSGLFSKSRYVILHVHKSLSAPIITVQPKKSITMYTDDTLKLSVSADGNPLPKFQWTRNDTIMSGKTDSVLTIPGLTLANNNSRFYCIVSNTLDTITSDTTLLTVEPRPKAAFGCTPVTGIAPLTVSFTDSSTGTIIRRLWTFGDSSTLADSLKPVHVYKTAGEYTVKLVVLGDGGVDSVTKTKLIYVYNAGENPVQVKGKYLTPTTVALTYSNLSAIDTSIPPPVADSLIVWYKADSIPLSISSAKPLISYPVSIFRGQTSFIDTVLLPSGAASYGIMTALLYDKKDTSKFVSSNGCLVLMSDTSFPDNQLSINGKYHKADSAYITIDNLVSIDTSRVDSVAVWYGRDTAKIKFDSLPTIWFSSKVLRSQPTGQYVFAVSNPMILDTGKMWCAVICKSFNKKMSITNINSFSTSGALPNPIVLVAQALTPGSILLKWSPITNASFTRMRLWKGISDVPVGNLVSASTHDSVMVLITDTSYVFKGLNANTTYYFGAQVFNKDGYWTDITSLSKKSIITPMPSDSFANKIKLTSLRFDSLTNKMIVSWIFDTAQSNPLDTLLAGISYSIDGTQNSANLQYIPIKAGSIKDSDTVAMKTPLLFDTTYYVALWMSKNSTGYWAKPTEVSSGKVKTTSFNHQTVNFFDKNNMTVFAANNTIKLWTDNVSFPATTDTLKKNPSVHNGFVVVNNGFYFSKKENTLPFYIGLSYSAIPPKFNVSQLKMYRGYADGSVSVDYSSIVDTINKFVYIKTDNLLQTFMLLIDTLKPVATIMGDTTNAISMGVDLQEKVSITDNINNVKWIYRYSRGDGEYAGVDSGYFAKNEKEKTITLLSSSGAISDKNGIRINLIITDGSSVQNIDLSRRVLRTNSDVSIVPAGKWFPLSVTAKLINQPAESLLVKINPDTLYDQRQIRLFQWLPAKPNTVSDSGWVEYSYLNSALFNFTPGKIIWIKTLKGGSLDFGAARTLSLKDTLKVKLPPMNYTDIALPYQFNMKLSDILSCTVNGDSLRFYKWTKKDAAGNFTTTPIYFPSYPNSVWKDKNIQLTYENGGGMTVYNPRTDTVTLAFPAKYFVNTSVAKSVSKDKSWSVAISCKTNGGETLQNIHYGYSQGIRDRYYPSSPSFISNRIALIERMNRSLNGMYQTGDISSGGIAKEIAIVNNSDSAQIFTLQALETGDIPSDFKTVFYNPSSGIFENQGNAIVQPHSTEYRWAITSNSSFVNSYFSKIMTLTYALGKLYPNPCRSLLNIPYTIPLGSSDIITFEMFDQMGRLIWKKEIASSQPGLHNMVWNGKNCNGAKISSGCYILRLTSKNDKRKITSRFQSKFTYLP